MPSGAKEKFMFIKVLRDDKESGIIDLESVFIFLMQIFRIRY